MKVERLQTIRSHLYANGPATIAELAAVIGSSVATVRRDLQDLEEAGIIDRVHGGAQIARGSTVEIDFEMRERQNLAAKRAIASAVYPMLEPHTSVFLDAGTTVAQVARRLRLDPIPLAAFTNGLVAAQELFNIPKIKVFMLGGNLRNENASLVGPQAEAILDGLWFDTLLLGVGAITAGGTICTVDSSEASLNRRMLARSTRQIILVDSAKFGTNATFSVGNVPVGATIVTDTGLSAEWRQRVIDWGANLVIAEQAGPETE